MNLKENQFLSDLDFFVAVVVFDYVDILSSVFGNVDFPLLMMMRMWSWIDQIIKWGHLSSQSEGIM